LISSRLRRQPRDQPRFFLAAGEPPPISHADARRPPPAFAARQRHYIAAIFKALMLSGFRH